jgi:heme exporter protein C
MSTTAGRGARYGALSSVLVLVLLAAAILGIFVYAPTEATMGHVQRIVYVHVAVAWLGLAGFLVMAPAGVLYLVRRDLAWDRWSQAAGELGWLSSGLTLVTGSLWAHEAWGTWWTWEPRLTAAFVLWAMYSGYLIVRAGVEDPHHRARLGAVLAILALADVPLVLMATRWFRGIHPVSPEMDPKMRLVLLVSVTGFSALFALLLARRRAQLHLESLLASLEQEAEGEVSGEW